MAILRKGPNGDLSGRIGDKIHRVRNKKNIVSARPVSQKISQSPDSVKNRERFARTIEFAKLIKSIPELYSCWKKAKIKGTNGFQRIIKHNSKLFSETGLTCQNIIVPPGLEACNDSVNATKTNIIIQAKLDKVRTDHSFKLVVLLSLYNEKESEQLFLQTDNVSFLQGSALEAIISFDPNEMEVIKPYNKALLFYSFVSISPKLLWKTTVSDEIDFRD